MSSIVQAMQLIILQLLTQDWRIQMSKLALPACKHLSCWWSSRLAGSPARCTFPHEQNVSLRSEPLQPCFKSKGGSLHKVIPYDYERERS